MNNMLQHYLENTTCDGIMATSPMEILPLLDGSEVKSNKCPLCKSMHHLERDCGFKVCPTCGSTYKVWNNRAYRIINSDIKNMTVNDLMLYKMKRKY